MSEFWRRIRTTVAFALLVLLATVTMISDRNALRDGGRQLSWYEGLLLDVTAPIQAMLAAPVHALKASAPTKDLVKLAGPVRESPLPAGRTTGTLATTPIPRRPPPQHHENTNFNATFSPSSRKEQLEPPRSPTGARR